MVKYVDYTDSKVQYHFDVNKSNFFTRDSHNYINVLGEQQLNSLENVSLLDIYLSKDIVVEPHIHQNAAELVYCISGSATVSLLNPFTKKVLNYTITPGQVANVPQGWWHYEIANTNKTHLLAIFNAPTPEAIFGSDLLRLTPPDLMAHTYSLDLNKWKSTISPINKTTILGPAISRNSPSQNYYADANYPQPIYQPYYIPRNY
ncbi:MULTISPECIES: cupin domain-containing protein [Niallia]|uniref:cupin domain-containing protein n=1 Tax=Niallia TaxID=2837506 RepID=UPI000F4526F6|nr:cupin domain-containing protein [Niallia circulans]AYV74172.1 cupin domain-containing protein [Niallia circulans]NRG28290.1 cupin domain-containing protein [Niallia circulans]QJX63417.1 cupin domain-containing protein [Niallia circulans]